MVEGIKERLKCSSVLSIIEKEKKKLTRATLKDLDKIPKIINLIKDVDIVRDMERCERNEYIILFITYLYSPQSIFGNKLVNGLRPITARGLEVSPARASNILANAIGRFEVYKSFRENLQHIYTSIRQKVNL